MRRALLSTVAAAGLALAGQAVATVPVPNALPALPGSVSAYSATRKEAVSPVYSASGHVVDRRAWVLSNAGGDCCETRLSVTASGRLLEFGGTNLIYSDDEGDSWHQVTPLTPLASGEGDVIAAPNGDVVAMGWDVYSGDHLQSYKYTAATGTWEVAEVTVRSPAYDRPWISIVKGPITVGLSSYPYAVVLQGGIDIGSQLMYISGDGLHYSELAVPRVDDRLGTTSAPFVSAKDRNADYWGAASGAFSTTLNAGGAVLQGGGASCQQMRIVPPSTQLHCESTPIDPLVTRQDSSGAFVRVEALPDGDFALETSRDGQRSWHAVRVHPVVHGTFEDLDPKNPSSGFKDLAVNGRLGFAALLTRIVRPTADGRQLSQDVVYVVDTTGDFPVVREALFVGIGGLSTKGGLDPTYSGPRLDFNTVVIEPSGRIATGYDDSECDAPSMAFERGVYRTRGGVVHPS